MNLIANLAKILLTHEGYQPWAAAKEVFKKTQTARRHIVNAVRGVFGGYPDALVRVPISGKNELYETHELEEEKKMISTVVKKVVDPFAGMCCSHANTLVGQAASGGQDTPDHDACSIVPDRRCPLAATGEPLLDARTAASKRSGLTPRSFP
jgi:hypothetical protein